MSNLDHQKTAAVSLRNQQELPEPDSTADETDTAAALTPSEVAMRINLLGKLIIPPSAP